MRNEFFMVILGILFALGVAFLFFTYQNTGSLIGFVISEEIEETMTTRQMALDSIEDAKKDIERMQENKFSIAYVNDVLYEAEKVLEQAKWAEVLRDKKSTTNLKQQANIALRLIKWEDITYDSVLALTNEIKASKERAFLIYENGASCFYAKN